MSINLKDLSQKLNWQVIIKDSEHSNIKNVCRFSDKQKTIDTTLYIIKYEDLKSDLIKEGFNYLCIDFLENLIMKNFELSQIYYLEEYFNCKLNLKKINLLISPQILKYEEAENIIEKFLNDEDYLKDKSIELYEALTSKKGIQHILNVANGIFCNSIHLYDNNFKLIAHSDSKNNIDKLTKNIIEIGYLPEDYIKYIAKEKNNYNQIYDKENSEILSDAFWDKRYSSKKLDINGKTVGHVTIIEDSRTFTKLDLKIFNILCKILSIELKNSNYQILNENQKFENLIIEILSETLKKELINDRIRQLDINFKNKNFFILKIKYLDEKNQNIFYKYLKELIERKFTFANNKSALYNNSLVILINQNSKDFFEENQFTSFISFLEEYNLIAGLSHSYNKINNTNNFYKQSCEAIRIGRRLDNNRRFYNYALFNIFHILDIITKDYNLMDFCNPKLLEIIEYDNFYHTEYAKTINIFITNNTDLVATAKKLSIHRNSLVYRINRIEEIFDIDFNDKEITFSLAFSLRILIYLEVI